MVIIIFLCEGFLKLSFLLRILVAPGALLWRSNQAPQQLPTNREGIKQFVVTLGPSQAVAVHLLINIMMGITITIPPGALSVLVEPSRDKGGCVVVEIQNNIKQSLKLQVNDIIISVNDIDYVGMAKMEGGEKAWVRLLSTTNDVERRLVVLRESGEESKGEDIDDLPLKNISNMRRCNLGVMDSLVAVEHQSCDADTSKTSSKEVKWKDERLLQEVVDNWLRGLGKRQSMKCMSAIQSCLLYDISPNDIARHVGDATNEQEHKRARECAKRVKVSMEKQREEQQAKLLLRVATSWTTDKYNCQTAKCRAAINACLVAEISPLSIARYVANHVKGDDPVSEYKRVEACVKRIKNNKAKVERGQTCTRRNVSGIKPLLKIGNTTTVAEMSNKKLVTNLISEFDRELKP